MREKSEIQLNTVFDYLVVGVMLYGVKLFGWKERIEYERIHQKYIRLDEKYC